MSEKLIRVGFIGLNPDSHWASMAHIPALNSLKDKFVVNGVANSTYASAKKTAEAMNIPHAFETPKALAESNEIDLVVVTVKVPYHLELVKTALEAGKHVYCEWPLGNGLKEAEELTALADKKGVVAAVGTQMRTALEVKHLKKLIAEGYIGKILSTTLIGHGGNWGDETIADYYYLFDKANGATMLTIPLGHTLAGMMDVLGDFEYISAYMVNLRNTVKVADTNEAKPKTAEDQIMVHGTLQSGAAFSIHYKGGLSKGTNLLWEINGTDGDIQVTGDMGHGQMVQLTVNGVRGSETEMHPIMPSKEEYANKPEMAAARNVAGIYALIAEDINTGSRKAPSFKDAVKLHKILDKIEKSSK